jgi:hypothetical protein
MKNWRFGKTGAGIFNDRETGQYSETNMACFSIVKKLRMPGKPKPILHLGCV